MNRVDDKSEATGADRRRSSQASPRTARRPVAPRSGRSIHRTATVKRIDYYETVFRTELKKVVGRLERIEEQQEKLVDNTDKLVRTSAETGERIGVLAAKSAMLENASAQLARQNDRFYETHVIDPLVRSALPMYDLVESSCAQLSGRENDEASLQWFKLLEALLAMLEEFFAAYGIEPFRHEPGARFDEQLMRPLRELPVSDKERHLTVQESCQSGFRKENRVIRHERVIIYVFSDSAGQNKGGTNKRNSKRV